MRIVKKSIVFFLGLILLATPSIAMASSTATTTITGTISPVVDVATSGEPYDLMVNIKSNCDMTVIITRVGDEITIEKVINGE